MALFAPSLSPAVVVKEFDLSGTVPNVETSLTCMVGDFKWGPVEEITRIQNESQLAELFGTPDADQAVDYLSAAQFLSYSSSLLLIRAIDEDAANVLGDSCLNAHSGITKVVVKNEDNYEEQKSTLADGSSGNWIAKYPGDLGNSLSVSIFSLSGGDSAESVASVAAWAAWDYANDFDGIPSTTEWATNQEGSPVNDEVHVAVIDEDGKFSGTKGAILETWPFLSIAKGAKTNAGGTNYMPDVINRASNYIWFGGFDDSDVVNGTLWGQVPTGGADDFATGVSWTNNDATTSLANGRDSQALTENEYALAFDLIEDVESVDVQILVAPGLSSEDAQVTVVNDLAAIATGIRKDCVVVASPPRSAVVNNATPVNSTVTFANRLTASNYLIVDNNYLRVYDKYNDQYLYIPAASSTAGLIAATDANYAPWYSPAGLKRGQYTGIVGLAYSANKADRDTLYKASINPIVTFPGEGTVLWGDKTKQGRPSAFDRINVRRLFLAVEKAISIAARSVLFEFNDEFTRSEFVGIIEPVLREVQARRGIQEFYVQCDETNNTPAVIDRNELIASIFIKPARSINFITLNFVAVRTGVSFEEVVGTV